MDMNNPFASVDWNTVEPQGVSGREVFDNEGWVKCIITDTVGKENNQKSGFGLTLFIKAMEGPDAGKTIDHFINVFHNNAKAQEIGQAEISAICHATGIFKPVDANASNFRNMPLFVKTANVEEEWTKDGETRKTLKTKVKGFDGVNGTKHGSAAGNGQAGTATAAPPQQTPAQAPAQQNGAAPSNDAPAAGWGPAPPSANGGQTPATAPAQSWGGNNGGDAPKTAPWGQQPG